MKINPIVLNLVSRRFLGFAISIVACYVKPEIQNSIILLYSAMIAHSSFQDWVEKDKKKGE